MSHNLLDWDFFYDFVRGHKLEQELKDEYIELGEDGEPIRTDQ